MKGFNLRFFEYEAYAKPITCVSGGKPVRTVKAAGSGLIVKPKDAGGLAEAVVKLYKDRELGAELGMESMEYVSEHLTAQKIGERMYEVMASDVLSKN